LLHITNGDVAAQMLAKVVTGQILPWRDVLHEGPVRAGLSLDELSGERARFIADCGWGAFNEVLEEFRHRDAVLQEGAKQDEVVLWFEHDLYDQLQLIQLLDWFAQHPAARLSLVCEAEYLGTMTTGRAAELLAQRKEVTPSQLEQGRTAWAAFTGDDPRKMESGEFGALTFLGAALRRQLQEYPWVADALSRLERSVVEALRDRPLAFKQLFEQVREEPAFLGDAVLMWHLERMQIDGLVSRSRKTWSVKGPRQRRAPRWLGGVRIDTDTPWRWDQDSGRVLRVR
jgi:Domain of unknown function (DUF1835)